MAHMKITVFWDMRRRSAIKVTNVSEEPSSG
jgi:hypothetical protein